MGIPDLKFSTIKSFEPCITGPHTLPNRAVVPLLTAILNKVPKKAPKKVPNKVKNFRLAGLSAEFDLFTLAYTSVIS